MWVSSLATRLPHVWYSLIQCSDPEWFQCGPGSTAFYLNAGLDRGQTNVDPDPAQILPSQKVGFSTRNFFMWVVTKVILKNWKSGLFVNFYQFSCSCIRIRSPNSDRDPDPDE